MLYINVKSFVKQPLIARKIFSESSQLNLQELIIDKQ